MLIRKTFHKIIIIHHDTEIKKVSQFFEDKGHQAGDQKYSRKGSLVQI